MLPNERFPYKAGKSLTMTHPASDSVHYKVVADAAYWCTTRQHLLGNRALPYPEDQVSARILHTFCAPTQRKSQATVQFTVQVAVYFLLKAGEVRIPYEGF